MSMEAMTRLDLQAAGGGFTSCTQLFGGQQQQQQQAHWQPWQLQGGGKLSQRCQPEGGWRELCCQLLQAGDAA